MILPRIQMNALKQKWKEFVKFWVKINKMDNRQLDDFDLIVTVFFNTKRRHDVDNQIPKFILDGLTEAGAIVDDDEKHLHSLTFKKPDTIRKIQEQNLNLSYMNIQKIRNKRRFIMKRNK